MITSKSLFSIYKRSFFNASRAAIANEEKRSLFHKALFNGVKMFCHAPGPTTYHDDLNMFHIAEAINHTVGFLTPNEFMDIFPPDKVYDGHKYEEKDYFSTMGEINKLELDNPIANQVEPLIFLRDYHNRDITLFKLVLFSTLSNLRQQEGHLELFEEFMATQGMETPNTFKNSQGRAMYVHNGKPVAIERQKKTGQLQVIK